MSFIVKGIDLPKERETLKIVIFPQGAVVRHKEDEIWETGEEYQAIQIPKGHGRIGDLDELQKAIRTDIMGGLNYEYFIRNAPTIFGEEE